MFDIGFWEILLLLVLGLLVLGPERLPRVARTLGQWTGRARSYVRQLSNELDRELQAQDLKREFEQTNKSIRESVQDMRNVMQSRDDENSQGAAGRQQDTPPQQDGPKNNKRGDDV